MQHTPPPTGPPTIIITSSLSFLQHKHSFKPADIFQMKTIGMALALPTRRYNKAKSSYRRQHLLTPTVSVHFFTNPQLKQFRTDLVRMCVWEERDWRKAERERLGKEICGGWGSVAHHAQPKSRIGMAGGCRSVLPLRPRTQTAPASVSTMASSSTHTTAQRPDTHQRLFPPGESSGRSRVEQKALYWKGIREESFLGFE